MAALESVRVLELASVLAGPLAATALAERGAHVTKVERPPSGDVTRSWKGANEDPELDISAYYEAANGAKQLEWMDLGSDKGQEWLEKQLASHDVLIENFKSADLEKFNLQPHAVATRHPHLIRVRLVGFNNAPDRLAYDAVVQAETGFMHMNGETNGPPLRMPVALMDVLASHQIRLAALEGLLDRSQGGTGFFAEVSLAGSGVTALVNQGTNWLVAENSPQRNSGLHPNIAPYGDVLFCKNGHLVLAIGNSRQFEGLCNVLQCLELLTDPRFGSNQLRVTHREELMKTLNYASASWEKIPLELALRGAGAPAGVVRTIQEVLDPNGPNTEWIQTNPSGSKRPAAIAYRVQHFGDNPR